MNLKSIGLALSLWPVLAWAQHCAAPPFETFTALDAGRHAEGRIEVEMQPVATLRIPSGFSRVAAMPDGSIGFGKHPAGVTVVLGFETAQTLAVHQDDAVPASFFHSIFRGTSAQGCRMLEGFRLDEEAYRLHARLNEHAEVFAYGTGGEHHFYVIRFDREDHVLNGFLRNISRKEFEEVLTTITVK